MSKRPGRIRIWLRKSWDRIRRRHPEKQDPLKRFVYLPGKTGLTGQPEREAEFRRRVQENERKRRKKKL